MDINSKQNLGLTFELYINFLLRKQFLLPVYIILTVVLFLACIMNLSPLFTDAIFTIGNIYLFIIFYSDNERSFNHFRRIFNINAFNRLFIKISLVYLFLLVQIMIIRFYGSGISKEVISFYTFFVSSILCLFVLLYEIKNILFKILSILVSALILFKIYSSILNYNMSLLMLLSLILITALYSVIKFNYEANNYF